MTDIPETSDILYFIGAALSGCRTIDLATEEEKRLNMKISRNFFKQKERRVRGHFNSQISPNVSSSLNLERLIEFNSIMLSQAFSSSASFNNRRNLIFREYVYPGGLPHI
jgi:hypothetical protein